MSAESSWEKTPNEPIQPMYVDLRYSLVSNNRMRQSHYRAVTFRRRIHVFVHEFPQIRVRNEPDEVVFAVVKLDTVVCHFVTVTPDFPLWDYRSIHTIVLEALIEIVKQRRRSEIPQSYPIRQY